MDYMSAKEVFDLWSISQRRHKGHVISKSVKVMTIFETVDIKIKE